MQNPEEIEAALDSFEWGYCSHCECNYATCPVGGCNSCAGGCHKMVDGEFPSPRCQTFWDAMNTEGANKKCQTRL